MEFRQADAPERLAAAALTVPGRQHQDGSADDRASSAGRLEAAAVCGAQRPANVHEAAVRQGQELAGFMTCPVVAAVDGRLIVIAPLGYRLRAGGPWGSTF